MADNQLSDEDFVKQYPGSAEQAPQDDAAPAVSDEDFIKQYQASAAPAVSDEDFVKQYQTAPAQEDENQPHSSRVGAFARGAAEGILPSISAIPGAMAGAALGLVSPIPGGALIGGLVGAVLAGGAAGYVQDKALEAVGAREGSGLLSREQQQADVEEHPYYRTAGNLASALVPFGGAASEAAQLAGGAVKTLSKTAQRVGGATIFGGLEAGQELVTEGTIDPGNVALAAGTGALAPNARPWTKSLADAGERAGQATARQLKAVAGRPNPNVAAGDATAYAPPATGPGDRAGPIDASKEEPAPTTPDAGGSEVINTDAIDSTLRAALPQTAPSKGPIDANPPETAPSNGPIDAAPPETAPSKGPEVEVPTPVAQEAPPKAAEAPTVPPGIQAMVERMRAAAVDQSKTPTERVQARQATGETTGAEDEATQAPVVDLNTRKPRMATPEKPAAAEAAIAAGKAKEAPPEKPPAPPKEDNIIGTAVQRLIAKGDEASLTTAKKILSAPEADQARLATASMSKTGIGEFKTARIPSVRKEYPVIGTDDGTGRPYDAGNEVKAKLRSKAIASAKEAVAEDANKVVPGETDAETKVRANNLLARAAEINGGKSPLDAYKMGNGNKPREWSLLREARKLISGTVKPTDFRANEELHQTLEGYKTFESGNRTSAQAAMDKRYGRIRDTGEAEDTAAHPENVAGPEDDQLGDTTDREKYFPTDYATEADDRLGQHEEPTHDEIEPSEAELPEAPKGGPSAKEIVSAENAKREAASARLKAARVWKGMTEAERAKKPELKPLTDKAAEGDEPPERQAMARKVTERDAEGRPVKSEPMAKGGAEKIEAAIGDKTTEPGAKLPPKAEEAIAAGKAPKAESWFNRSVLGRVFGPGSVSEGAKNMAAIIREQGGINDRQYNILLHNLEAHRKIVSEAPEGVRVAYQKGMDTGNMAGVREDLRPMATVMAAATKDARGDLEKLSGMEQQMFVDHHWAHQWLNEKAAKDFQGSFVLKQGSAGSLHPRTVPTLSEGLEGGLKLRTTDPIEVHTSYIRSIRSFIEAKQISDKMVKLEMGKWFERKSMGASGHPEGSLIPEGWDALHGREGPGTGGGGMYAPRDVARVYNNYVGKAFAGHETGGKIADGMQRTSNMWTALELGLNGFHFITMVNEAFTGEIARGISKSIGGAVKLARGDTEAGVASLKEGLKVMAMSPTAGYTYYKEGKLVKNEYLTQPGIGHNSGAAMREIVDLLTRARAPVVGSEHDASMKFAKGQSFVTAARRGALKGQLADAKARIAAGETMGSKAGLATNELLDGFGRILTTVAEPLFDRYIPNVKNGANSKLLGDWLGEHPLASDAEKLAMTRKIVDSTDNRYGEMQYDNLFWDRTMKQVMQIGMRSPSWTFGTIREIGGGVASLVKNPSRASITSPDYDPRAAYAIALPIAVALTSAVYQYLKTGEPPKSARDLIAGRTGGKTVSGQPERAILPGYEKDVLGWFNNPSKEAYNKMATAPRTLLELAMNKDWRDKVIYNPADSPAKRIAQAAQHVIESMGPISLKQMFQATKRGSNINFPERTAAVRAAPTWLEDPQRTEAMKQKFGNRDWKIKTKADQRDVASRVKE